MWAVTATNEPNKIIKYSHLKPDEYIKERATETKHIT
jgi:hypothetical protein